MSADDGEGETLPWDTDVFRKEDERIFDCIDREGWRPCPARGVSSLAGCASASGSGEVGAGGIGSTGDSTGAFCFSSDGVSAAGSGDVTSSGFSSAGASAGAGVSVAVAVSSVEAASLDGSSSLGVSVAVEAFLLAFFFCFWSWATCKTPGLISEIGACRIQQERTLFLAAASFSALTRSSSSAMVGYSRVSMGGGGKYREDGEGTAFPIPSRARARSIDSLGGLGPASYF